MSVCIDFFNFIFLVSFCQMQNILMSIVQKLTSVYISQYEQNKIRKFLIRKKNEYLKYLKMQNYIFSNSVVGY